MTRRNQREAGSTANERGAARFALLLLSVSAVRCGSEGGKPETLRTALTGFCDLLARCHGVYASVEACVEETPLVCGQAVPPLDTEIPGAAACMKAIGRASCAELGATDDLPPDCAAAMNAVEELLELSQSGEGCASHSDCAEGLFCDAGADTCGSCAPQVGVGESCEQSHQCEPGTYCDGSTCTAKAAVGQPCDRGQRCIGTTLCRRGVCALPSSKIGEPCGERRNECDMGLLCVLGTCQRVAGAGDACVLGQCQLGYQCDDGRCVHVPACGTGEQGDLCNSDANCQSGLGCQWPEGICQPDELRGPLGSACDLASDCKSQFCLEGSCADPSACPEDKAHRAPRLSATRRDFLRTRLDSADR